jgi:phytoene dehydrogenase-like protein
VAEVVVVGGGFGGMASAARLAKLGHSVTLLERSGRLGGALGFVERDGFRWDAGPAYLTLPGVVRDLFRKSGRPLERELELVPVESPVQHRFDDGVVLDLPVSGRGAQAAAVEEAFGRGSRRNDPVAQWTAYVDQFADVWAALRRDWLERPWSPELAGKEARSLLSSRMTLHKLVHHDLRDEDLRVLALHQAVVAGHDPRNVPAFEGMWSYVEQNFGRWTVPGGVGALTAALEQRLGTRGVTVLRERMARDLVIRRGRAVAVRTDSGEVDADAVVVAIDPRLLPALARHVARAMPAIPPVVCHIGVVGEVPDLPHEVVVHGEQTVVLRTLAGSAPEGAHAWTLLGRGRLGDDLVTSLHREGIRVRDQVQVRVDRSPKEIVEAYGGSPMGVLWQGRNTLRHRLGTRTPVPNVVMAGAHTTPGAGLPAVGLSAALVAQVLGPA